MTDNKINIEHITETTNEQQAKSMSYQRYLQYCILKNNIDPRHFRLSEEEFKNIYNFSQKDFTNSARDNYRLLYEDDYKIMMDAYKQSLDIKIEENKENNKNENIDIIMRQTDLTRERAEELLINADYDYEKVIKTFLSDSSYPVSGDSLTEKNKSTNQKIYTELRNYMDGIKYTK
jgi:NACalpha-BTF3-like transcription factor